MAGLLSLPEQGKIMPVLYLEASRPSVVPLRDRREPFRLPTTIPAAVLGAALTLPARTGVATLAAQAGEMQAFNQEGRFTYMINDNTNDSTPSGSSGSSQVNDNSSPLESWPVVYTYTRKQALADETQFDVSGTAKELGFTMPVFITCGVKDSCVSVPDGVDGQDEAGRLWDVLWMLRLKVQLAGHGQDRVNMEVQVRTGRDSLEIFHLVAVCSAMDFDDPRPCITVMLPQED